MNGKRITVLVISIVLTAVLVFGGVMAYRIQQAMADPVGAFVLNEIVVPEAQVVVDGVTYQVDLVYDEKSYVKKDNILNVVILGRDKTPSVTMYGYSDTRSDGGNTDIMIVMAIDLDTAEVQAISIPRDSIAHIYHYSDTKDEINGEYFDKLNGAYGAGPRDLDDVQLRNSVTCIQEYLNVFGTFDIEINNYVEIGLAGLMKLTDEVGGVEVTLTTGIPEVGAAGQTVNLTAYTAMRYVRDRHNTGGDLGRVSNAQMYIKALARKLQEMGVAEMGPTLAKTMMTHDLMHTDLTVAEIGALAQLMVKTDVSAINMKTVTVIPQEDIGKFKSYLENYDYNYEAFYGASKWRDLDIKEDDYYDYGFFTDYEALEEVILDVYYEQIVFE